MFLYLVSIVIRAIALLWFYPSLQCRILLFMRRFHTEKRSFDVLCFIRFILDVPICDVSLGVVHIIDVN